MTLVNEKPQEKEVKEKSTPCTPTDKDIQQLMHLLDQLPTADAETAWNEMEQRLTTTHGETQ